jgi:hypothetical protein
MWQPKREERATTGSSVTWHILGLRIGDQGGGGGWIRGATHLGAPCFLSCSLSCSLSQNLLSASLLNLLSSSNPSTPSFAAKSAWLGSCEHSRDGNNRALTWALRSGWRWRRYGGRVVVVEARAYTWQHLVTLPNLASTHPVVIKDHCYLCH